MTYLDNSFIVWVCLCNFHKQKNAFNSLKFDYKMLFII